MSHISERRGDIRGGTPTGAKATFPCVLALAKREPSALLLAAQLAAVLAYPFMIDNDVGRALFSVFGIAILGLVVLAVRSTPGLTWVTILLGVPRRCCCSSRRSRRATSCCRTPRRFEAVLYFYAAGAMIAYMLADQRVTRDELFAIGATFTLVAWAFAYTYTVCQAIDRGSFTAAVDPTPTQLDGAAVPELHDAVEHGPERHRPGQAVRARRS